MCLCMSVCGMYICECVWFCECVSACVCVCVCVVCVCGAVTTEMGEATVPSRMAWREGSREFEKGSGAALGPFPSPR